MIVGLSIKNYISTWEDAEKYDDMLYRSPYDDMHFTYHGFGLLQVVRKIAAADGGPAEDGRSSQVRGRSIPACPGRA